MGTLLPLAETDEAFAAIDPVTDYAGALRVVAERSGMDASTTPARFEDGSVPVFALGDRVVKLYPPSCTQAYRNERAVLEHVDGTLPIATPRVEAAGALDGWHYLVMTRLQGRPLRECFDGVPTSDRARLASALGEAIGRMHAMDTGALPRHDWPALLERRRRGAVERHLRAGLSETWLARIEPFLDTTVPELPVDGRHSLLHTEIMREHVFVEQRAGRFELSGLLDFEPSCVGPPEYELASVGLFLSEGDALLWSAFLDGLGLPRAARGESLGRRCMAWALLHRYANLRWWLERQPPRSTRQSFDDLASEWFDGAG